MDLDSEVGLSLGSYLLVPLQGCVIVSSVIFVLVCPLITGLGQAPLVCWNRGQEPDVVQALLQDSSDKAYGKKGMGLRQGFLGTD